MLGRAKEDNKKVFIVDGMNIKFHRSSYEPTDNKAFDSDETYELILHGNGVLSRDWEGSKIVKDDYIRPESQIQQIKDQLNTPVKKKVESKQEYSSCGFHGRPNCNSCK